MTLAARLSTVPLLLAVMLSSRAPAQSDRTGGSGLSFASGDVARTAQSVLGDSSAWPVLMGLAEPGDRPARFRVNGAARSRLSSFAAAHRSVRNARSEYSSTVAAGAPLFAPAALDRATQALRAYDAAVRSGDLASALVHQSDVANAVRTLRAETERLRVEDVEAKLAARAGIVDKRKGMLGSWAAAATGDLFATYDGVRTGRESRAYLLFVDGMEVVVDPVTTVVVRESRRDRLTRVVDKDLVLVNGSMLSMLSPEARQSNRLTLSAGPSESRVASGRFWASADRDREMRIANYDGTVDLTSNNVEVRLERNQGTVAEKGKAPLQPVDLLPPPLLPWRRVDTVVTSPSLVLRWKAVAGAQATVVERSSRRQFDEDIRTARVTGSSLNIADLAEGTTYFRLTAMDRLGLRGIESPAYAVTRLVDRQPPALRLQHGIGEVRYAAGPHAMVRGLTEEGAIVVVDGTPVNVGPDGSFTAAVRAERMVRTVTVIARDASGNVAEQTVNVARMDSVRVLSVAWNCQVRGDLLTPGTDRIQAAGESYPGIAVELRAPGDERTVLTDSRGVWGLSVAVRRGSTLTLTFRSVDDGTVIGTRTYRME